MPVCLVPCAVSFRRGEIAVYVMPLHWSSPCPHETQLFPIVLLLLLCTFSSVPCPLLTLVLPAPRACVCTVLQGEGPPSNATVFLTPAGVPQVLPPPIPDGPNPFPNTTAINAIIELAYHSGSGGILEYGFEVGGLAEEGAGGRGAMPHTHSAVCVQRAPADVSCSFPCLAFVRAYW